MVTRRPLPGTAPYADRGAGCAVAGYSDARRDQPGSSGVLFLDELTEYPRPVLECLGSHGGCQHPDFPGQRTFVYPADFMLVAAMNPCPVGYYPDGGNAPAVPVRSDGTWSTSSSLCWIAWISVWKCPEAAMQK